MRTEEAGAISDIIRGCLKKQRESQKVLYRMHYAYGMSICMRYANDEDEAITMLNDGFLKVFRTLNRFDESKPFRPWLRTFLIRSSLDFLKKKKKQLAMVELKEAENISSEEDFLSKLSYQELLGIVQSLSTAYRTVFNLFAIDGYSHEEISKELGISIGTSKSNLSRARVRLQEMVKAKMNSGYAK